MSNEGYNSQAFTKGKKSTHPPLLRQFQLHIFLFLSRIIFTIDFKKTSEGYQRLYKYRNRPLP
ncbi:hypothetical protein JCM12294_45900 [Desulfocicer niacini]